MGGKADEAVGGDTGLPLADKGKVYVGKVEAAPERQVSYWTIYRSDGFARMPLQQAVCESMFLSLLLPCIDYFVLKSRRRLPQANVSFVHSGTLMHSITC
jgi:hypothetical protein